MYMQHIKIFKVLILYSNDFILDFEKLPLSLQLGFFFKEFRGKKKAPKILKIGKIRTIFGFGMTCKVVKIAK